jgi:hypothetical protein
MSKICIVSEKEILLRKFIAFQQDFQEDLSIESAHGPTNPIKVSIKMSLSLY